MRLNRLTSLRFFAAILVVVHHTTRDLGQIPFLTDFTSMGTAGVGFFFVLSGFVLTWSSRPGDTAKAFYRRRFARVYPLHLLTFLAAVPLLLFVGQPFGLKEALPNVLLLQSWIPGDKIYFGMNAPSWSLSAEMFFYLMFPLVIGPLSRLTRKQVKTALLVILAAGLVLSVAVTAVVGVGNGSRFLLYILPLYRFLGFLAGCLAARMVAHGYRSSVPLAGAGAFIALAYSAVYFGQAAVGGIGHGIEDALLAPFVVVLILSAVTADLEGKSGFLTKRSWVRLGEWSFALYLTHWLLLQVVAHVDSSIGARSLAFRALEDGIFIVAAVAVSGLAYEFVERPLERRLRGARPRPEMVAAGR